MGGLNYVHAHPDTHVYPERDALVQAATLKIHTILKQAIKQRGHASIMLSGGSSPRPVYEALGHMPLDWASVTIGLVDERWVNPGQPGSNETFLRDTLLQGPALQGVGKAAKFVGLKSNGDVLDAHALTVTEKNIANIDAPFDLCVMGMGLDGHTASWFSGAAGLKEAMDMENTKRVAAIDASGCPVAGDYPSRITLTLGAVLNSRNIILLIPGQEKAEIFKSSANGSVSAAPVKALYKAGQSLTVMTDKT